MLQYIDRLIEAYARGEIVRGNAKKCAVGMILKSALGYADARWFEVMIASAQGVQTPEDEMYARYIEQMTGLTIRDVWKIEGAFEGHVYVPRKERAVTNEDIPTRLARVFDVLREIEEERLQTV